MGLETYRRKRDFGKTPEPRGRTRRERPRELAFVVQKHAASRLHYDFRLELGGVLKSWAVPKGPSLDPRDKRLAVHVEDHPLEYGSFEGVIPEGQYGGGTVMLWDRGRWEPEGDPEKGYREGRLAFRLEGEKLRGRWVLSRMAKGGEEGKDWLLIKRRDDEARPSAEFRVDEALANSVESGRSLEEIARDAGAVWRSDRPARPRAKPRRRTRRAESAPPRATRADLPERLEPQLATRVPSTPAGDDWLHEIKHDGYRILAFRTAEGVRLVSRNGLDWTARFPEVARAVAEIPVEAAILDGELVALRPDGTSDFQLLQRAIDARRGATLAYYVFDLPFANGLDLRRTPLAERKALLERILESARPAGPEPPLVRYSDHVRGQGPEVWRRICRLAVEGVVSKRADAPYESGRTRTWTKTKCVERQEFVIAGTTRPAGSRTGFGSLVLGVHEGGRLVYCGKVGTGFDEATLRSLTARLRKMEVDRSPLAGAPRELSTRRGVRWVRPELVAEVEFAEWTGDGILRHPSFQGLREDKDPAEVRREGPARTRRARGRTKDPPGEEDDVTIAGVTITNPHRILYPEQGVTKAALAGYYQQVADWILPHVVDRPLALVRCPSGRAKPCFYQKHLDRGWPAEVEGIELEEKAGEKAVYIAIRDLPGLVALVQMGVLEIHPWGSRTDRPERPDRLVFDLDPGPDVAWPDVLEAAGRMREALADLELESFVRTTGGKGLHVVVPIARTIDWDEARSFAKALAGSVRDADPDRYLTQLAKARRKGKILIDWLRNGRNSTAVASYSTRARPGAPVAVNLAWDELPSLRSSDAYTALNLPRRLAALDRDPWDGFFEARQAVKKSTWRRLEAASAR